MSSLKEKFLAVEGPVFPIPVPFDGEEKVNYDALRKYCSFLLDAGAQNLMVTAGTSWFSLLSVEEALEVNATVAKAVGNRGISIVTTPTVGCTAQAQEFVREAAKAGADGILGFFPDRFYAEEDIYGYFQALTEAADIGILIHEMPIRSGAAHSHPYRQYPLDLLERIIKLENVVGLKEECLDGGLAYRINRSLAEKCLVVGGAGGMRSYLAASQWGQRAYLTGIGNFLPELELEFFQCVKEGRGDRARQIIFDEEEPFFSLAVELGWHAALKEAMDIMGVMPAGERAPISRMAPKNYLRLAGLMRRLGWVPLGEDLCQEELQS